jgi:hypothetical protein
MDAAAKSGALTAVALMVCAVVVANAQAQVDINPDDTAFTGTATNPTWPGIACDTGTITGRTNTNSNVVNVALAFFGNCNAGGLPATITCSDASDPNTGDNEWDEVGTARLEAVDPTTNTGVVDRLNTGFSCDVVVENVCTVRVGAQELPIADRDPATPGNQPGRNQANLINEGTGGAAFDVVADVIFTNDNELCGPTPSGVGTWAGLYAVSASLGFDPAQ